MSTSQTVLVTGSNSGFGRLIVETLARQGHTVFAAMRQPTGKNASAANELHALAEKENLNLHVVALDVTNDASVSEAIDAVIKTANHLDVVVNNAGVSYLGPLEAFSIDQAQQQFNTNVFGVLRVIKAALPQMRVQHSGLLIQVSSILGRLAFPYLGLYGSTKFALESLTETYHYELAPQGIEAILVEPGTYPTSIGANRQTPVDQERFAPYAQGMNAFMPVFFAENRSANPPNPQDVADSIAALIAAPAGSRPLRTLVAPVSQLSAPQAVNAVTATASKNYLEMLGLA